jgi:hypothetical protein
VKKLLTIASLTLAVLCGRVLIRAQSETHFPAEIEAKIGADKVKLVRTGSAYRKSAGFKVYAVASYLRHGVKLRTPEQLAQADEPKLLELIFIMKVPGDQMASSFCSILRQNYPEPAFTNEIKALTGVLEKSDAKRDERIWIAHIPKVGLHCRRESKDEVLIRNVDFSRAVWNNYFGENNCGELVKLGLVSEMARP